MVEITLKLTCRALIFDLVEFASQALHCAVYGPITVAVALLRKPFKENLFFLEWIVAAPEDFVERFFSGDAEQLVINKIPPARKLEIIRAALNKTDFGEWQPSEFIYELRFDKKSDFSLEPLWQKANHLITTQGALKTEGENINFIFSNEEDRDSQWRAFFTTAPILFFHALETVHAAISMFSKRTGTMWLLMQLRTAAGMILWMRSKGCIWKFPVHRELQRLVQHFIRRSRCPKCAAPMSWREENLRRFFEEGKLRCFKCGLIDSVEIVDASAAQP